MSAPERYDGGRFHAPRLVAPELVSRFDMLFDTRAYGFFSNEAVAAADKSILLSEIGSDKTLSTRLFIYEVAAINLMERAPLKIAYIEQERLFDLDVTIGEMVFFYVRYGASFNGGQFQISRAIGDNRLMHSCWFDSMRAVAPKHEAFAWLAVSQVLGLVTPESAEEGISRYLADGWAFDDLIPFVQYGLRDIDSIRHALNNGIDPSLMLTFETAGRL